MSDIEMAHKMMELEPTDLIEHGLLVVGYLNGETNKRETGWCVVGTPSIDQTVGLMMLAIHRIDHESDEGSQ